MKKSRRGRTQDPDRKPGHDRKNVLIDTDSGGTSPQPGRRRFLNRLWALFAFVAAVEYGWLGFSFMNSREGRGRPSSAAGSIVTAGPLAQFAPGTVTAIPKGRFYLARLSDGTFLALSRTCTHLGCSVLWNEEKRRFVCPCHGSAFELNGTVITPPAPRPLDTFPVRIENGIIKVDIASARRREHFDPSQATGI